MSKKEVIVIKIMYAHVYECMYEMNVYLHV